MAISSSASLSRPIPSLNAISSASFRFCNSHNPRPQNPLLLGCQNSPRIVIIRCGSSELGPSSDPTHHRHPPVTSFPPFNMRMSENGAPPPSFRWRRVLLKVSGEALAGDQMQNIDPKVTMAIAREVASVTRLGIEVAIVVGGGNIFRGSSWAGSSGLERSSADYIGYIRINGFMLVFYF